MLSDLKYLIKLQEIDLKIKEQENAKKQLPLELKKLQEQIELCEKALKAIKDSILEKIKEKEKWEEQIQKATSGLQKSNEKLNSIKTNREYDAVHAEIENFKSIISSSEQKKKAVGEEIEKLKQTESEKLAEVDKVKNENLPQIKELQEKINSIDSVISSINKDRESILPHISKPILRQYEQMRIRRKNGLVVSCITSERVCSVCHKVLEPQYYNEVKKATKVILCQGCGSMMVWGVTEEEK
ncbi:MAG: hypothetical protein N2053_08450 [Chitinispirillaceae bacterium]|nr:hypothetical protein [Chitinispirillaceae bacterium]